MRNFAILALVLLASCASQKVSNVTGQLASANQYQADLAYCQEWATPTRHEWAMRCQANGDLVLVSSILDSLSSPDPRDQDVTRQNMPNNTDYRFNMCMKSNGNPANLPGEISQTASR